MPPAAKTVNLRVYGKLSQTGRRHAMGIKADNRVMIEVSIVLATNLTSCRNERFPGVVPLDESGRYYILAKVATFNQL